MIRGANGRYAAAAAAAATAAAAVNKSVTDSGTLNLKPVKGSLAGHAILNQVNISDSRKSVDRRLVFGFV